MLRRTVPFVLVLLVLMAGTAYAAPNDPGWSAQWHLRTIHADRAWLKSKGAGVVVAVVDTGVDLSHPDLRGRLLKGEDLVDPGTSADDQQGHGTFMAGLIAADTGNAEGVASVAPLAKILPIRVLDANGTGDPRVVARGIDDGVTMGARVINLSLAQEALGGSGLPSGNLFNSNEMDRAITSAARSGVLVVAAAGNNFSSGGASTPAYHTTEPGVLVVGASTKSDRRARYSDYGGRQGDGLDVLAPGGGSSSNPSTASCQSNSPVVSTWWNKSTGDSAYGAGCGTSMAVAQVSGIAALLIARGYSNVSAAERIRHTAVDLYQPGWDPESGWGRVDAAAAVGALSVSHPKPKPKSHTTVKPRSVGAAGTNPAVKGTKIVRRPAPGPATPTAITGLALASSGPYGQPDDPRLRLFALALAMSVGVGVAQTVARRAFARR
jgi:serine protease